MVASLLQTWGSLRAVEVFMDKMKIELSNLCGKQSEARRVARCEVHDLCARMKELTTFVVNWVALVQITLLQVQTALSSKWSVGFNEGFDAATKALKDKYPHIDLFGLCPEDFWGGPEMEPETPYPQVAEESAMEGRPAEVGLLPSSPIVVDPGSSQVATSYQVVTTSDQVDPGSSQETAPYQVEPAGQPNSD